NTNQIIFSSNRNNDTTNTRVKGYKTLPVNYNLFLYDLDSSNNIVQRITNTVSKDIRPIAKDEDNYYYLSDQRGIMNLFRFTRSTGIYSQITNFNSSIEEYDLNFYSRKMTMVTDKDLSTDIFQFEDETPKTSQPPVTSPTVPENKPVVSKPAEKDIDTDDYTFEDEAVKSKQPSETFLTRYMKARETNRVTGPFPYEPKFNYNNLVTNLVIDPIRSYSVRIETQMNDMLENNRFYGGLQTAFAW